MLGSMQIFLLLSDQFRCGDTALHATLFRTKKIVYNFRYGFGSTKMIWLRNNVGMYTNFCHFRIDFGPVWLWYEIRLKWYGSATMLGTIYQFAELHHFYAAPAPSKTFDRDPTLPYSRPTFLKSKKVIIRGRTFLLMVFYDCNCCQYELKSIKLIQFVTYFSKSIHV
jgi:hypothetical protein